LAREQEDQIVIRRKLLTVAGTLCTVVGLVLAPLGAGQAGAAPSAERQRTEAVAAPTVAAEYLVRFINLNSQKCLGVESGSQNNGARVLQWTCNGEYDQLWRVRYTNAPIAEVINYNSGRCLAIASGSLANGGLALQWTCNNKSDQRWDVSYLNAYAWVVNANSARCLSIESGSRLNGARALQWTCGGQADQQWYAQVVA
jgi:hypothetical protein